MRNVHGNGCPQRLLQLDGEMGPVTTVQIGRRWAPREPVPVCPGAQSAGRWRLGGGPGGGGEAHRRDHGRGHDRGLLCRRSGAPCVDARVNGAGAVH